MQYYAEYYFECYVNSMCHKMLCMLCTESCNGLCIKNIMYYCEWHVHVVINY